MRLIGITTTDWASWRLGGYWLGGELAGPGLQPATDQYQSYALWVAVILCIIYIHLNFQSTLHLITLNTRTSQHFFQHSCLDFWTDWTLVYLIREMEFWEYCCISRLRMISVLYINSLFIFIFLPHYDLMAVLRRYQQYWLCREIMKSLMFSWWRLISGVCHCWLFVF